MRSTTKKVGTLLAATTGALFLTAVEAPQADAADLSLSPGSYSVDTTTLKLTGPSVDVTGTDVAGVAVFTFDAITVPDGATITATGTRPFELLAATSLDFAGTITASGVNATDFTAGPNAGGPGGGAGGADASQAGTGPGGGGHASSANNGGGGGGFGGRGARGGLSVGDPGTAGTAGAAYGNLDLALQGGSGGGGASVSAATGGGGGGGAVALVGSAVTLESSAVVSADGGGGAVGGSAASGGGSGGGVIVHGNTVSVDGIISVTGGQGGLGGCCGDGGGGAGGRIAIQYKSLTNHASLVIHGGSSGTRMTSGCCSPGPGHSPDARGASGLVTFTHIDPSKLTIGASKTVKKGTTVTVATTLTDGANGKAIAHDQVTLFKRTGTSGPFTKLVTKTTSTKGAAKVLLVVKKATQFQWRYAGSLVHDPASSAKQSIRLG